MDAGKTSLLLPESDRLGTWAQPTKAFPGSTSGASGAEEEGVVQNLQGSPGSSDSNSGPLIRSFLGCLWLWLWL